MSVHYKFKSALEYDTVTFDGLHISVKDLKNAIIQQKRIGRNTDFDLQVTNAQTKRIYSDDHLLIPKNTSLLIARVPLVLQNKGKAWEGYGQDNGQSVRPDEGGSTTKAVDLSSLDAPEDDKIMAMMSQSTQDYDPSNYVKIRGANQVGQVPPNYRCYKCHQAGHWIKDCATSQGNDQVEIKKSTGIPRSFMVEVEGPQVQGAMMTPYGSYAVPALDHQTYTQKNPPSTTTVPSPAVPKTTIPDDLMCSICSDLLTDAVMIPCCGNSFCDECIRSFLLESEDHECPDCHERDISPGTLIPNRFLRNSVANFKSTTGYVKRQIYKPAAALGQVVPRAVATRRVSANAENVVVVEKNEKNNKDTEKTPELPLEAKEQNDEAVTPSVTADDTTTSTEKTIISEADSTEPKSSFSGIKESLPKTNPIDPSLSELPPGVSPTRERSPEMHPMVITRSHGPRSVQERGSPRRQGRYSIEAEDRSGTPTVDEPGNPITVASGDNYRPYSTIPIPPPTRHHVQGPIHRQNNHQPYNNNNQQQMPYGPPQQHHGLLQGGQPNYRMHQQQQQRPTGFMGGNGGNAGGMYNMQPRAPLYEQRPPMPQGNLTPQPCYQNYQNRPPRMRTDYNAGPINPQTPPRIIDDPLEAFNRMLREKDERERRAKAANRKGRSYSRSSSRSYSRSPPSRRRSTRSPRRRTRSRSKSYSISRSRSRSYSSNHQATSYRDYSPRRRAPSRYRSHQYRSPTRFHERNNHFNSRERERERPRERERDRDYPPVRENRGEYPQRNSANDYNPQYYDNYERDKGGSRKWVPPARDDYYPQQNHAHSQPQHSQQSMPNYQSNRYNRDYQPQNVHQGGSNYKPSLLLDPPIMMQGVPQPAPQRRFVDVLPPGTDQPLPPGEEPVQRFEPTPRYMSNNPEGEQRNTENEWERDQRVDERYRDEQRPSSRMHERQIRPSSMDREREQRERNMSHDRDRERDRERNRSRQKDKEKDTKEKEKPKEVESRSPSRRASNSPHKRKSRRDDSPSKSRGDKEKKKEKDRDPSEDEKAKKSKEKKKKRDKKESEKKKKKDRKEKKENKRDEKETKKAEMKEGKSHNEKRSDINTENKSQQELQQQHEQVAESSTVIQESEEKNQDMEMIQHKEDLILETDDPHKAELFGDASSDGLEINKAVVPYHHPRKTSISPVDINPSKVDTPLASPRKDKEEDVLELDTGELKSELDKQINAPTPQLFKWEMEEEPTLATEEDGENDAKLDKSKVTQDVLKRAENAIFAKAINAIRPIEIKKISVDRAKLYSGEKDREDSPMIDDMNETEIQEKLNKPSESSAKDVKEKVEMEEPIKVPPVRLSVKERLGHKVDDLDRIVQVDHKERRKSKSLSPLAKRSLENKDRRVIEVNRRRSPIEDRNRDRDRHWRDRNIRDKEKDRRESRRDDFRRAKGADHDRDRRREEKVSSTHNKERPRIREEGRGRAMIHSSINQPVRRDDLSTEKRKRSRSKSKSRSKDRRDDRKKKDKKQRKDRDKDKETETKDAHSKEHSVKENPRKFKRIDSIPEKIEKSCNLDKVEHNDKSNIKLTDFPSNAPIAGKVGDKRKVTLDEENFIPDYDAESEHDQHETDDSKKRRQGMTRSSSSSSESSSDEAKKRKKHKKHGKKKKRRDTSTSSSSESSSTEDEKEKSSKKKKHKKKSKKKKKSKHKS